MENLTLNRASYRELPHAYRTVAMSVAFFMLCHLELDERAQWLQQQADDRLMRCVTGIDFRKPLKHPYLARLRDEFDDLAQRLEEVQASLGIPPISELPLEDKGARCLSDFEVIKQTLNCAMLSKKIECYLPSSIRKKIVRALNMEQKL